MPEATRITRIESLPPEIIREILSFLPLASLAVSLRLSQGFNAHSKPAILNVQSLSPLTRSATLRAVCLTQSFAHEEDGQTMLASLCAMPTLEHLELHLSMKEPSLGPFADPRPEYSFEQMTVSMRSLRVLRVTHSFLGPWSLCEAISSFLSGAWSSSCNALETFIVRSDEQTAQRVNRQRFLNLFVPIEKCRTDYPYLKRLTLQDASLVLEDWNARDVPWSYLLHLERLSLSGCGTQLLHHERTPSFSHLQCADIAYHTLRPLLSLSLGSLKELIVVDALNDTVSCISDSQVALQKLGLSLHLASRLLSKTLLDGFAKLGRKEISLRTLTIECPAAISSTGYSSKYLEKVIAGAYGSFRCLEEAVFTGPCSTDVSTDEAASSLQEMLPNLRIAAFQHNLKGDRSGSAIYTVHDNGCHALDGVEAEEAWKQTFLRRNVFF